MTTQTSSRAPLGSVGALVDDQIRRLQQGYLADRSAAVATLARLRRGAGRAPMAVPDLWGLIDLSELSADPQLAGEDAQVRAQNAAYAALTLWALHQQSRQKPMHRRDGLGLGGAVRRLMPGNDIDEPVRKRFVRAGAAPTWDALTVRLREVVTLLRREEITLDYALLADQLHTWQHPHRRAAVRDAWGRSFHAYRPQTAAAPVGTGDTAVDETDPKDTP
ncbi:type I-E CRISPR-associated protein Cse2/CasB [Streptomyces sp. NPDC021622]|uniref:type I-E CRISPR-associated protein Cse2/CasB n=1 Tax=Streptomyces sp. NPDC021622 TaxID=3155013 RepID=UPI0033FC27BE